MYRVYQMHRGKKVPLVAIHKGQEETAEIYTQEEATLAVEKLGSRKKNVSIEYVMTFEDTTKTDYFD